MEILQTSHCSVRAHCCCDLPANDTCPPSFNSERDSTAASPRRLFAAIRGPNKTRAQSVKMGKRKLDINNEPAVAAQTSPDPGATKAAAASSGDTTTTSNTTTTTTTNPGFSDLGLDSRLLQAIASQKYQTPTLVQSKVVPLALNGQDVLAKAKTGSGKTAAYLLPLLHAILKQKQVCFVSPASSPPSPQDHSKINRPSRPVADLS